MIIVAQLAMVGAAGLCLGGSVRARRPLGIAASAAMLLAMCDLAWFGIVPAPVWAALLLCGGLALGVSMRWDRRPACSPGDARDAEPPLHRAVSIASALAYVAMAWLVLGHDHSGAAVSGAGSGAHAGHGGSAFADQVLNGAILLLAVALAALAVLAARRRRGALAVESGGMAAMILAMLLPALF